MIFKIDISKLTSRLQLIEKGLQQAVSQGLQEVTQQGANIAQAATKGDLANSTMAYKNSALQQGIKADKPYASWVEYGNGPPGSRIYPIHAKALHFYVNGTEVFAKSVQASAPKPFMAKAVSFINRSGTQIVADHISRFLKG